MAHPLIQVHQVSIHTGSGGVPNVELNGQTNGFSVLAGSDLGEFRLGVPQLDFDEAVNYANAAVNSQLNVKRGGLITSQIPVMITATQPGELEGRIQWLRDFLRQDTFTFEYTQNFMYGFSPEASTWPATFPYDFVRTNGTELTATSDNKLQLAVSAQSAERTAYWNSQARGSGMPMATYGSVWKFFTVSQCTAYSAGTGFRRGKLWIYDSAGGLLGAPYLSSVVAATDASPVYSDVLYKFTHTGTYAFQWHVLNTTPAVATTGTFKSWGFYCGPCWRFAAVSSPEPDFVIDGGYWAPGAGGTTSPAYRARVLVEVLHSPVRTYTTSGNGVA